MLVESCCRVGHRLVEVSFKGVDLGPDIGAARKAIAGEAAGQGDVTHAKAGVVGIVGDHKRGVPGAQEVRPARPCHARDAEISRQSRRGADLGRCHRAHRRVKAHEGPATDRNAGRGAGHHVMIAGPVIALVMADRADDRQFVGDRPQSHHVLRQLHPGDTGVDRLELASELRRGGRFGVEGFVMSRATVHPDQDAAFGPPHRRLATLPGGALQSKGIGQAAAEQGPEAELQAVSPGATLAVGLACHDPLLRVNC